MESVDYHSAAAMLAWQIELGADESICDQPLNRYELPAALAKPAKAAVANDPKALPTPPPVYEVQKVDGAAISRVLAAKAGDLAALEQAVAGFEHCELKRGARNMLFGQGVAGASVMVIGDAPNRDDDRAGVFLEQEGCCSTRCFRQSAFRGRVRHQQSITLILCRGDHPKIAILSQMNCR